MDLPPPQRLLPLNSSTPTYHRSLLPSAACAPRPLPFRPFLIPPAASTHTPLRPFTSTSLHVPTPHSSPPRTTRRSSATSPPPPSSPSPPRHPDITPTPKPTQPPSDPQLPNSTTAGPVPPAPPAAISPPPHVDPNQPAPHSAALPTLGPRLSPVAADTTRQWPSPPPPSSSPPLSSSPPPPSPVAFVPAAADSPLSKQRATRRVKPSATGPPNPNPDPSDGGGDSATTTPPTVAPKRSNRRRSTNASQPPTTTAPSRRKSTITKTATTTITTTSGIQNHSTGAIHGGGGGAADSGPTRPRPPPFVFSRKVPALGGLWDSVRIWVVFSDLHVRDSSLNTCLEVLRRVAREAVARGAGIIFLGDFWDKRGALPVEPLNRVMQELSSWTCPLLMLVGNHDQVDLGGRLHSLTPLEMACPRIHVFDEPALWGGALWLPYRRDTALLTAAIRAAEEAAGAAAGEPLRAVFMHADVRTARTNQWRQADEGLDPGALPPTLPTYSGHYHLPHTVRETAITYVGSPYQVSMNEASESKRLLVLSSPSWTPLEVIPLALGPRHVRLSGPEAVERLREMAAGVGAGGAGGEGEGAGGEEGEGPGVAEGGEAEAAMVRGGDRVKVWLSESEAGEEGVVRAMQVLESAGVVVEQVLQPQSRAPRLPAAEGLGPRQVLDMYCGGGGGGEAAEGVAVGGEGGEAEGGGGAGGLSAAAAAAVREAVAAAVAAVGGSGGGGGAAASAACVDLELEWVTLRGFGPFLEEQTYPLASRGVVAVVGENLDEGCADSNGAGKTSLVAAPLWALTGEMLARTESGGGGRLPVDALRNERCSACRVVVRGTINGEPFRVEREVRRGKTSCLSLEVGGEDLTLQAIPETADRIRTLFAVDLLRSCAFFGQNDITGLLEANDAALKQKLGLVVDLEIWESARQLLVAPRRAAAAAAASEEGRAGVLRQQAAVRAEEVAALVAAEAAWEAAQKERRACLSADVSVAAASALSAARRLYSAAASARQRASELREAAAAVGEELSRWEGQLEEQRAAQVVAAAHVDQPQQQPAMQTDNAVEGGREGSWGVREDGGVGGGAGGDGGGVVAKEAEAAAGRELRRRREDVEAAQQLLADRQTAASLALGRLRQHEASVREYEQIGTQLAAAGTEETVPSGSGSGGGSVNGPHGGGMSYGDARQQHACDGGHVIGGSGTGSQLGAGVLQWDEYGSGRVVLAGGVVGGGGGASSSPPNAAARVVVCDRCRQPISELQYQVNLERLRSEEAAAQQLYDTASIELHDARTAHERAVAAAAESDIVLQTLVRRRMEAERSAAAAAMAAAAAAERRARAAAEAAARAQEAAWRGAEVAVRQVQMRVAASTRRKGGLLAAALDLERTAADLDQAAAAWAPHAAAAEADAVAAVAAVTLPEAGPAGVAAGSSDGMTQHPQKYPHPPQLYSPRKQSEALVGEGLGTRDDDGGTEEGTAAAGQLSRGSDREAGGQEDEVAGARAAAAGARQLAVAAAGALVKWQAAGAAGAAASREVNPKSALRERAAHELAELQEQLRSAEAAVSTAAAHHAALTDADRALGRSGIPALLLEGVLAQLQAYTSEYLQRLAADFVLELVATKTAGGGAAGGADGEAGGSRTAGGREKEEIQKVIKVRDPISGELRQRDVRQLSGGERRRVALALCLGFEALVRRRRRLVCNTLVLDEVLQQLDNTGCELVAGVLRDLPHDTVLVVGQSNSSVVNNFDRMDVVVKERGAAHVRMAG